MVGCDITYVKHTITSSCVSCGESSYKYWYEIDHVNPLSTGNVWGCNHIMVSIVDADGLVLKHQAISIHNTDLILILRLQFQKKWLLLRGQFYCCKVWDEITYSFRNFNSTAIKINDFTPLFIGHIILLRVPLPMWNGIWNQYEKKLP